MNEKHRFRMRGFERAIINGKYASKPTSIIQGDEEGKRYYLGSS